MARGGINKAVVQIARNALLARGLHPSIDAVRVELGNTGSKTTIQRYLKELSEVETPAPEMPLDEELSRYIASVGARIQQRAEEALATDRAAFDRQQLAARQQREMEAAHLEHLQQAHAALGQARQAGLVHEQALSGQLQACELERQRLLEAHEQQLRLLEDRAGQILSLEGKHRLTQEALEHYREQHLLQRDQEIQRHDQQLQQLQREARINRDQLLNKQEELSQLYRDLERMSGEQLRQHQEMRRLEQALQSAQEQVQAAELEHQSDLRQLQAVAHQLTALREKAKQQLLKQRQVHRELRARALQISQLQTLVERLTRAAPTDPD
ncbi:transposase [Pseudomonas sp. ODNR1LW]|nr:transposase [Pseudomonas sp. ODNR1LW]